MHRQPSKQVYYKRFHKVKLRESQHYAIKKHKFSAEKKNKVCNSATVINFLQLDLTEYTYKLGLN